MTDRNPAWMWLRDLPSMEDEVAIAQAVVTARAFLRTPDKSRMYAQGPEALLEGWAPAQPFIDSDTRVIAFGSCFAARFVEWLIDHGYNQAFERDSDTSLIRNLSVCESPGAVAQQFRWAFGEFDSQLAFWFGKDRRRVEATEEDRLRLRATLSGAEVLIITLGLSEMWFDAASGEPIWRVPPRDLHDPRRYAFKVATVAETTAALETIARLRRTHVPAQKILFTVSPVRLSATFRRIAPIVANVVSKAVIRAALDEFLRAHADELNRTYFYFPSYEIATELMTDLYEADNLHIREACAARILDVFSRFYVKASESRSGSAPLPHAGPG
jgi:hypothetical protein